MKKRFGLIGTMLVVAGLSNAATLNEWNFYSDPAGKKLSQAVNSKGLAAFVPGNEAALSTDGFGLLRCTQNDPGSTGMWTNGARLVAPVSSVSSGVQYLRYDFSYNLTSFSNNNSGCIVGFSFYDGNSNKVVGVALQYDIGAATGPYQVTEVGELDETAGSAVVVAKLDLNAKTLSVWYERSGDVSGFLPNVPLCVISNLALTSFNSLGFQATGDIRPTNTTDQVDVKLLRTADSWADILAKPVDPYARYSNEWTFERDANGTALSAAINSGTNFPLAHFAAGYDASVYVTNHALLCSGDAPGAAVGVWTNGAMLDAALSATSGVHYLRYDVDYDLRSTSNNSGTVLGVYFAGNSGAKTAGLILGYDQGFLTNEAAVAGRTLTSVTGGKGISLSGTLTAIAEVTLNTSPTTSALKVWYDLSGSNTFNMNSPSFQTNITLTTIENLRFHATGDFCPANSTNFACVDNIRHSGSFSEIIESPVDSSSAPLLSVTASRTLAGAMEIGETNEVTVLIRNSGGSAGNVSSTLIQNGSNSAFTIISNNSPVATLASGASVSSTYRIVANAEGSYVFTVNGFLNGILNATNTFIVLVGPHLGFLPERIIESSGGMLTSLYEPGETLNITITTTNDGRRTVSNITNSLIASNGSYFIITNLDSKVYSSVAAGQTVFTTYSVLISSNAQNGPQTFYVTNSSSTGGWGYSFSVPVFLQAIPGVSTSALTLFVERDATAAASISLENRGNLGVGYTVADAGDRPSGSYAVVTQSIPRIYFQPAQFAQDTVFTNWLALQTASTEIGFEMPVFGRLYNAFSVNCSGTLTLISTGGVTVAMTPLRCPVSVSTNSVRFLKGTNQLVVAWGNRTGSEFQVQLNADGTIQYLYELDADGSWGAADIRIQNQVITHRPGLVDRDSLLMTPAYWVSYSPVSGILGGHATQPLIFTADAAGQSGGTNMFETTINWNDGKTDVVLVTVVVIDPNPVLEILSPQPFIFYGYAGAITRTNMVVANTGNITVSYIVTDSELQGAGYMVTNAAYSWTHIPVAENYILSGTQLGARLLDIGFPFVYFGNVYTALTVNANGTLSLGGSQTISPFGASLSADGNASIRFFSDPGNHFSVTWENMAQAGGGSDQTFQAVLSRNGEICFNYAHLESGWTNGQIRLVDSSGEVRGSLSNASTTAASITKIPVYSNSVIKIGSATFTNQVKIGETTNITVSYTATANSQRLDFIPSRPRIISALPFAGTISAGATTNIVIIGDARSLNAGIPNTSVTNSTALEFSYYGKSTNIVATFIATNSMDASYPMVSAALAESMWGSDPIISCKQNMDGSRIISWPVADDGLSRTYAVYFSTNLMGGWKWLATVKDLTSYSDTNHSAETVVFYKVTVQ